MSTKNKRPYSEKHGPDSHLDPMIEKEINKQCKKQEISCPRAFEIAHHLNVKMLEVGRTADLMNIRVVQCQLGLFGHKPKNKIVRAEETSDQALLNAIKGAARNNRLTCEKAWQIADQLNISKQNVSNASQANGIKIKSCQLGAF
jgi:hypothetical protein